MVIKCPRCKELKPSTRHHIIPKFFSKRSEKILLCRDCHDIIEQIIRLFEGGKRSPETRLSDNAYRMIVKIFT